MQEIGEEDDNGNNEDGEEDAGGEGAGLEDGGDGEVVGDVGNEEEREAELEGAFGEHEGDVSGEGEGEADEQPEEVACEGADEFGGADLNEGGDEDGDDDERFGDVAKFDFFGLQGVPVGDHDEENWE